MTTRAARRGLLRRAVLTRQAQPFSLDRYYLFQLPAASLWTGAQVHVIDEVDGPITCFSDGTNWRRITDRAIATAILPTAMSFAGEASGSFDSAAGPYMVITGVGSATFSAASFVGAGISATGEADGSFYALGGTVTCAISATGAATATFVGDLGTGEPAELSAIGAGTATFGGFVIGAHSAVTATGQSLALFTGASA